MLRRYDILTETETTAALPKAHDYPTTQLAPEVEEGHFGDKATLVGAQAPTAQVGKP